MPSIQDLLTDPDFRALPADEQRTLRSRFFHKHIAVDQDFIGLSEKEQAVIKAKALGESVLREQPSTFERMTQPGGIASPESIGMVGGSILGLTYGGLVGGPPGALIGGLAGAITGGVTGRGTELAKEAIVGPGRQAGGSPNAPDPNIPIKRSIPEVRDELGLASQRAMTAEALGQGMAGAGRLVAKPFAKAMTPSADDFIRNAKEFGMDVTAGEILQGTNAGRRLALLEAQPGRYVLGIAKASKFQDARAKQAQTAAEEFIERISPGTAKDVDTIAEVVRAGTEGRRAGLKGVAKGLARKVAGEKPVDLLSAGEALQTAKKTAFQKARAAATNLYDRVENIAGPAANQVDGSDFLNAAQRLVEREKSLAGVRARGAGIASAALRESQPQTVQIGGASVDPAQLPAQLVKELGLDQPKAFTFQALREWQSRLGELIRTETNRRARRGYVELFNGVSKSIKKFGDDVPNLKPALDEANSFYRRDVAELYLNKLSGKIDNAEADAIAKLIIRPKGSVFPLQKVRDQIGKDNFNKFVGAYLDDIAENSVDKAGRFDVTKYLATLDGHDRGVLNELMGNKITAMDGIMRLFRANPNKLIDAIANKEDDQLMNYLVRKQGTTAPLDTLKQILPKDKYDQFAGAAWKRIVTDSLMKDTGEFSIARFMSQVNSPTGYTQGQLKTLLGGEYGMLRRFVGVLEQMRRAGGLGVNPSETARGVLTAGQFAGGIALGASIMVDASQGDLLAPGSLIKNIGGGIIVLHPVILAKVLYSPGGIKWLTTGMTAPRNTAMALKAINRITAIAATDKLGIAPRPDGEFGEDGLNPVKNILSDVGTTFQQKMEAVKGLATSVLPPKPLP